MAASGLGLVAAAVMMLAGADRGLRVALFLPFAIGALGLLQARDHT